MTKIYLNCNNIEKKNKIKILCGFLQIEVCYLNSLDLNKKINEIIESDNHDINNYIVNIEDLLLFYDFDDNKLNEFLSKYRQNDIEKISLKAVVTPFNIKWSLSELIKQLREERLYYEKNKK